MNPRVLTGIATWISILIPSQGCGPFFPDTVLNQPQAALDVPPVSYLHGLYRLTGRPLPNKGETAVQSFLSQIPLESAELRDFWRQAGVNSEEIERRIGHYESVRQQLLAPIVVSGPMDFPTHGNQPPALPVRPLGNEFPTDVADYVEAARLHAGGQTAEARTLWKGILERPPAERKLRAAWAAWMLAKTSPDIAGCLDGYARVETEIEAGATDAIGLRGAAKAWRAAKMDDDPLRALQFYHDAFAGGKDTAAIDIRRVSRKLLDTGDAANFATAAANPLIRRLLNLALHASLDGPRQMDIEPAPGARDNRRPPNGSRRLRRMRKFRWTTGRAWLGRSTPPVASTNRANGCHSPRRTIRLACGCRRSSISATEIRRREPEFDCCNQRTVQGRRLESAKPQSRTAVVH